MKDEIAKSILERENQLDEMISRKTEENIWRVLLTKYCFEECERILGKPRGKDSHYITNSLYAEGETPLQAERNLRRVAYYMSFKVICSYKIEIDSSRERGFVVARGIGLDEVPDFRTLVEYKIGINGKNSS